MPRPRQLPEAPSAPPSPAPRLVPIFLDFEGVLRPANSKADAPFHCAELLVEPLLAARRAGLDPRLIIASTYRLDYSWRQLAALLDSHAPGIGQFISGATPEGGPEAFASSREADFERAPRLFEASLWIEQRAPSCGESWIAIDDSPRLYGAPNLPAQLILCDPDLGFSDADALALSDKLGVISRSARPQASAPR